MLAEIAYVAYALDRRRGCSRLRASGHLRGQWRTGSGFGLSQSRSDGPEAAALRQAGRRALLPPLLVDNADTWLDFSDLVFIDPVGTGYSRFVSGNDDARRLLWSVEGDYKSLARFVANWLRLNDRLTSPKFLVGESYGGFRAPKIASELQTGDGVGLSGIVLLSPVLDFTYQRDARASPLSWAVSLPASRRSGSSATASSRARPSPRPRPMPRATISPPSSRARATVRR